MAEKNTSQSQHQTAETMGAEWRRAAEEAAQRLVVWMAGLHEDVVKAERAVLEQADRSLAEGARVWRESAEYGSRLAAEWRAVALESSKRAVSMAFPQT